MKAYDQSNRMLFTLSNVDNPEGNYELLVEQGKQFGSKISDSC